MDTARRAKATEAVTGAVAMVEFLLLVLVAPGSFEVYILSQREHTQHLETTKVVHRQVVATHQGEDQDLVEGSLLEK